jgi:hypothetical protein
LVKGALGMKNICGTLLAADHGVPTRRVLTDLTTSRRYLAAPRVKQRRQAGA